MLRYTYDANGEQTGYEYVEPTPQPSGMAKGASYYPFKDRMLRYEEEEEPSWTKSSAQRVTDAKVKEAQAAVWAADAAYEQTQACAPGSTMEYAARKAWEEANRALTEARAAQAAVESAKTPMSLSKAVSSAETAARNSQTAADTAQTNANRAVESARKRANDGQSAWTGITTSAPAVELETAIKTTCADRRKVIQVGNYVIYKGKIYEIPSASPIINWDPSAVEIYMNLDNSKILTIDPSTQPVGVDGWGVSGTIGLALDVGIQAMYVEDKRGNRAIVITFGVGGGLGASVGLTRYFNNTFETIEQLEDFGVSVGGTIAVFGMEMDDSSGGNVSFWPDVGLEFHSLITKSIIIYLR